MEQIETLEDNSALQHLQTEVVRSKQENSRLELIVQGQAARISHLESQLQVLVQAMIGADGGKVAQQDELISQSCGNPLSPLLFTEATLHEPNQTPPPSIKPGRTPPTGQLGSRVPVEKKGGALLKHHDDGVTTPSFAALCSTFKLAASKAGQQPSLQLNTPQAKSSSLSRGGDLHEDGEFSIRAAPAAMHTPRACRPVVHWH